MSAVYRKPRPRVFRFSSYDEAKATVTYDVCVETGTADQREALVMAHVRADKSGLTMRLTTGTEGVGPVLVRPNTPYNNRVNGRTFS